MNNLLNTVYNYFDLNQKYDDVTILSNLSAIIYDQFPDINWVGFYLFKNNELILGPFQGKPACMKIALNRGVCGHCASTLQSIIVNDVHLFPGHIACDSASNSELVVAIIIDEKLYGLLDIDSPLIARFSDEDLQLMTNIVKHLTILLKK
mgnify:CR=1 FL=1